jgi:electron transport complex protein RnfB
MEYHEVYHRLAEKYHLVGDEYFLELLQVFMTLEEGKYVLELDTPKTPAEVARIMGEDEAAVAARLDNLARRGMLFRGDTQYLAWMDAHQLKARAMFSAEEYTPPTMLDVRRREKRYMSSPYAEIHHWLKLYEMTGHPLIRIIPARKAIAASPAIDHGQVLWYEDIVEMMRRAGKIGVIDCDCRRIFGDCNKPLLTCFHFGNMVDYEVGRGGRMKAIGLEEAIELSDIAEEAGLVHNQPGNFAGVSGVICNCCNDCCSTFDPAIESGRIDEIIAPSRFRPSVDAELCKGCQVCLKRCPFGAIVMVDVPGSDKQKANVLEDKCLGCGVCVLGCRQGALTFNIVRPPDFIPPVPAIGMPMYVDVR